MRVPQLYTPKGDRDLFEEDPDALKLRAFMTGDIFEDVPVLGGADGETMSVAIVGHPCVIRGAGGQLLTRVPCCVVNTKEKAITYDQWPDGSFDVFPLTDGLDGPPQPVVRLLELVSVHKGQLKRDRRVRALTPRGVFAFQQRFAHALTRVAPPLNQFELVSGYVVEEGELEVEWLEAFVDAGATDNAIGKQVKEFHRFLDETDNGRARRLLLREPGGPAELRKAVRAEIKRRVAAAAAS